ncbi:MAG TPA: hypothetical protein VFF63_08475 [Candidatus Babeliales bacterium]|nr:hypothetical protein [Candidatus Babeliales bacterium]
MMRNIGLLLTLLLTLSAQAPAQGNAPLRHLVYQFGYNTPVASSGNGTGTTTIDIIGPAPDGGVMISGQDFWWNTVRPRATNTCDVHPDGGVSCSQAPNAISPMQLTIFPLLARSFFTPLNPSATSSWTRSYHLYLAIIPGASGYAGQPTRWNCTYSLVSKGPIPKAAPLVLIESKGTLDQQGGTYLKATSKQRIVYDPVAKVPAIVRDIRTHFPQRTVYNNDLIELKLVKDSHAKQ